MNVEEADDVTEALCGFWPTPVMEVAEVKAWYTELCDPALKITLEEAGTVIAAVARSGAIYRMRPGQLVPEVRRLRHRRFLDCPLPELSPPGWETDEAWCAGLADCRRRLKAGSSACQVRPGWGA